MALPVRSTTIEGMVGGVPGVDVYGLNTLRASNFAGLTIDASGNLTAPASVIDLSAATNLKLPASVTVVATPDFTPASDAINAFEFTNAADSVIVLDIDTTNQRIGIGNGAATPGSTLDIQGSSLANCSVVVKSTNANSFTVGRLGTTAPAFNVDCSAGSQAAGLNVVGAATGGTVALQVSDSGAGPTSLTLDSKAAGTIGINTIASNSGLVTIGNTTNFCGLTVNGPFIVNGQSGSAVAFGQTGAANPVVKIDLSGAASGSGISFKGAATGVAAIIQVIDPNSNAGLTIAGKGTGTIILNPAVVAAAGGQAQSGVMFGSLSVGLFTGTGAPSFSAMNGSIYVDSNATTTTTRIYVNKSGAGTAGTTWTNLTTAA